MIIFPFANGGYHIGFVVVFALKPSDDSWPPFWFCCRLCFESISWFVAIILVLLSSLLWIYELTHYYQIGFVVVFSLNQSADSCPPYWFCCRICFESISWLITTVLVLLSSFLWIHQLTCGRHIGFVVVFVLNLWADSLLPHWLCCCLSLNPTADAWPPYLFCCRLWIYQLTCGGHCIGFVLVFAFNPSADSWPPYWFCPHLCF